MFGRRRSIGLLVLAAAFATFATLVELGNDGPILFDVAWLTAMEAMRTPGMTSFVRILTDVGGTPVMVPLTVLLTLWIGWRSRRSGAFMAAAFAGSAILNEIFKNIFARPRPEVVERVYEPYGLSFPSGHSQASMTFAITITLVALRMDYKHRHAVLWLFLLPVIVGWTRTYLGVHYPTDVLGGFALGAIWVLLLDVWYVRVDPRPIRPTTVDAAEPG